MSAVIPYVIYPQTLTLPFLMYGNLCPTDSITWNLKWNTQQRSYEIKKDWSAQTLKM